MTFQKIHKEALLNGYVRWVKQTIQAETVIHFFSSFFVLKNEWRSFNCIIHLTQRATTLTYNINKPQHIVYR